MTRDGRYGGGNDELSLVLRVDTGVSGVISGDVSRGEAYLASVRTAPGLRVAAAEGRWSATWQDNQGATTTGALAAVAVPGAPDRLAVTLRLDAPLNALASATDLTVTVDRVGDDLRDLGIEIETEQGVVGAAPVDDHGTTMIISQCLRGAGFAVLPASDASRIPAPSSPWDYSMLFTILNDLMASTAQTSLSGPSWNLHLLLLSRCSLAGLVGIMFDQTDPLPRQGSAVFATRIRELVPAAEQDRDILRTCVHELGHALNLAHRFERVVGRADSTSFMNYPSRYLGGGHEQQYWDRFTYMFDADELEFLRHGPRASIRPGDAAFHSVRYWADGGGGYVPYLPEVKDTGLGLALTPPQSGPVFALGQPMLLGLTLENQGTQAVVFGSDPLDQKTGGVEVLIRRLTGTTDSRTLADAVPFIPMMQACILEDESTRVTLQPGEVLHNNVNLTFGSGGFAFAEPGTYELTPLLSLPSGDRDHVAVGAPLQIRVGYPHDVADEHDALVLLRADAGAYFALGGSDCLRAAEDDLMAVYQRRHATSGTADPIAAGIARAVGINASRPTVRLRDGRFHERAPEPARAVALLGGLDAAALRTFDPHTARHTAALAERLRS